MKFSDMMGKGDTEGAEVTDTTSAPTDAGAEVAAPQAPIRFGASRSALEDAAFAVAEATAPAEASTVEADAETGAPAMLGQPSIRDVMAELAPRPATAMVTDQQLDSSAWLDDIPSIDDDLLPT